MNNIRRKSLRELMEELETVRDRAQELLEEEEEYRDSIPENLQGSERYEKAEETCDNLATVVDNLDEALTYIEESIA